MSANNITDVEREKWAVDEKVKMRLAVELMIIYGMPEQTIEEIFSLLLDVFTLRMKSALLTRKSVAEEQKNSIVAEAVQTAQNQPVIDAEYVDTTVVNLTPEKEPL